MTTADQVNKWLQFALQQIAAESYLEGVDFGDSPKVIERLKYGFNNPDHVLRLDLGRSPASASPRCAMRSRARTSGRRRRP